MSSDQRKYEQRHFRRERSEWSDWYPSSKAAYREHRAGPVKCFDVRDAGEVSEGSGRTLADANSNPAVQS